MRPSPTDDVPPIRVHDLHKSFDGTPILCGLSIDFARDTITTVLGPSGTGKSVLIKHLVGLFAPDSGEILIHGENIWRASKGRRYAMRKQFGVLFQDGALFGSMNLFDNIAYPLRRHTDKSEDEIGELVMTRMREVGLDRSAAKFPNEISGGMRKRAGFARALALNPSILIFDEPDSGLDPVRTSLLNDLVLDIHSQHGGTYIVVTHDISTARKVSDYVGVLWKGRLVHHGEAEAAFDSDSPFVRQFLSGDSVGPLGMD